ncbi:mucoidy inhibitor MuiA family protein [Uliginosibacterium sediminicola]|uniref:Mucoidy inhibitor MuiA family protein n=1 Tax=Uliginosibacterium sediminicola TaxID=2024550 RepID=A0ABU9YW55_9RHOO
MRSAYILLAGLFINGVAQAQNASRIARVTLYPGSAMVERSASLAAGATRLVLAGLPAGLDVSSLRVEGDPGIRIGDITTQDVSSAEAVNPRQAELEAKLQALDDQLAMLDVERQSAELVTHYLQGLGGGESAAQAAPLDARTLATALEAIRRGGSDAYGRIQRVLVQKRSLQAQRDALQREIERLASSSRDTRTLSVQLAAERAGEVRVSYQIKGPGWQPLYRASLDSANARVELERQAQIAQNTGEDWTGALIRLSTDQPRNTPQGATPRPWQLSLRPPVTVRMPAAPAPAPAAKAAPELMLRAIRQADAREEAPLFDVSALQTAFSTEFEVPGRLSVPSDGRKLTVLLGRENLPVKLRVQALPRQDSTAYVVAEAERPQGVWLSGEIQLYRDRSYVGATRWNAQAGEKFELPFGRDDLVRITVTHPKVMSGESGFIAQRGERQILDVYTVSNQHKQAVELLLLEASPVSTAESISVDKRFEPKPAQENWQDLPGVIAWQQRLAAGATQKFSVDYRISWPKDSAVIGLP